MAGVRQLPSLYLRGALANITMRDMTPEQVEHVGEIVEYVAPHPAMIGHRKEFADALGRKTIKADYIDPLATEQEYKIAIWRAAVHLFYYRSYTFRCDACLSGVYLTKRGKPSPINRKMLACPNCGKVRVADPGDTAFEAGSFVDKVLFQDSYKHFGSDKRPPKCVSPISPIPGPRRHENPQQVLDDPVQLAKYFGEFLWNYLRQQLNENSRPEHRKQPRRVLGPADEILVEEILAACVKNKVAHTYYKRLNPENGYYRILVQGLKTAPEFTTDFNILLQLARGHGIEISATAGEILVKAKDDAPTIETLISRPEQVLVLDAYTSIGGGEEGEAPVNQITYRTIGDERVNADDHAAVIESSDVLKAVRDALPDGHCKDVFDIYVQRGPAFERFTAPLEEGGFGDGPTHTSHIAKFLGIGTRTVGLAREQIKVQMLAHGLVPK